MLTAEMNDRLARVGPGTPCGELFRRYWVPFLPAAKLDEDPVQPVRLLGEDLTCYRDKSGNVGLIGQRCLHRAVDLRWGIPEDNGLRCPYHGWLYDAEGVCVEAPLEARPDMFKDRLNLLAGYPVREMGGLLFAYMGPAPAPLLPPWDLFVWPNAVRQIGYAVLNANWLQCQENTGDPTHGVYLHGHLLRYVLEKMGDTSTGFERIEQEQFETRRRRHQADLYVHPTQYGMEKGVIFSRELGADADKRRRATPPSSSPSTPSRTPPARRGASSRYACPSTTSTPTTSPTTATPLRRASRPRSRTVIPYYEVPIWDENGKPVLDCVLNQDFIGWWSQGPLTDRTAENLGRTDIPVVFLRRQLDENIKVVEDGGEPMNVFRDAETMGDILYGGGAPAELWLDPNWASKGVELNRNTRAQYHKGGQVWESDRYGPALPLVGELHRRMEEAVEKATAE